MQVLVPCHQARPESKEVGTVGQLACAIQIEIDSTTGPEQDRMTREKPASQAHTVTNRHMAGPGTVFCCRSASQVRLEVGGGDRSIGIGPGVGEGEKITTIQYCFK